MQRIVPEWLISTVCNFLVVIDSGSSRGANTETCSGSHFCCEETRGTFELAYRIILRKIVDIPRPGQVSICSINCALYSPFGNEITRFGCPWCDWSSSSLRSFRLGNGGRFRGLYAVFDERAGSLWPSESTSNSSIEHVLEWPLVPFVSDRSVAAKSIQICNQVVHHKITPFA